MLPVSAHRALIAAAAAVLCACTTTSPQTASSPAPAIDPLPQYMQRAAQATAEGSRDRARDLYATAAKAYPTSKEPWLKLAQDHFELRNYGQAILAAQEVLQRDPGDTVATSILAVSGLRVSAAGLSGLRRQQQRLGGDTRNEAEEIVRTLRELLGEPVLVPPPAASGGSAAPAPAPTARPRAVPRQRPAASAPAPTAAPAAARPPAPATAPPNGAGPSNPFKP